MDAHSSLPSTVSSAPAEADATRELQRRVNDLRQIDNVTNWWYIVREYVLLALTVGLTIAFYQNR